MRSSQPSSKTDADTAPDNSNPQEPSAFKALDVFKAEASKVAWAAYSAFQDALKSSVVTHPNRSRKEHAEAAESAVSALSALQTGKQGPIDIQASYSSRLSVPEAFPLTVDQIADFAPRFDASCNNDNSPLLVDVNGWDVGRDLHEFADAREAAWQGQGDRSWPAHSMLFKAGTTPGSWTIGTRTAVFAAVSASSFLPDLK